MAQTATQTPDEVQASKRAYVRGFVNTLKQAGATDANAVAQRVKQACAYREELFQPETQERLQKRANAIGNTILESVSA